VTQDGEGVWVCVCRYVCACVLRGGYKCTSHHIWSNVHPFGSEVKKDTDSFGHVQWSKTMIVQKLLLDPIA